MTFAPICVRCSREMRCRKNDYMFSDYGGVAIWSGDMYGCESCNAEVVIGFAKRPIAVKDDAWFMSYCLDSQLQLTREPTKAKSDFNNPSFNQFEGDKRQP